MPKKKLYPNHRIYKLELATSIISVVINRYENEKDSTKIIREDGFLYCAALNHLNADRKFHQRLGKSYKKNKK